MFVDDENCVANYLRETPGSEHWKESHDFLHLMSPKTGEWADLKECFIKTEPTDEKSMALLRTIFEENADRAFENVKSLPEKREVSENLLEEKVNQFSENCSKLLYHGIFAESAAERIRTRLIYDQCTVFKEKHSWIDISEDDIPCEERTIIEIPGTGDEGYIFKSSELAKAIDEVDAMISIQEPILKDRTPAEITASEEQLKPVPRIEEALENLRSSVGKSEEKAKKAIMALKYSIWRYGDDNYEYSELLSSVEGHGLSENQKAMQICAGFDRMIEEYERKEEQIMEQRRQEMSTPEGMERYVRGFEEMANDLRQRMQKAEVDR